MKKTLPQRKSIRHPGHDYSLPDYYFITICTDKFKCYFGEVKNNKVQLNKAGNIIKDEWLRTEIIRKNVRIDEWIIMPNHLHGIIEIIVFYNAFL